MGRRGRVGMATSDSWRVGRLVRGSQSPFLELRSDRVTISVTILTTSVTILTTSVTRNGDLGSGRPAVGLPLLPVGGGNDVASDKGVLVDEAVALGTPVGQDGPPLLSGVSCCRVGVSCCGRQRRGRGEGWRGVGRQRPAGDWRNVGEAPATLNVGRLAPQGAVAAVSCCQLLRVLWLRLAYGASHPLEWRHHSIVLVL